MTLGKQNFVTGRSLDRLSRSTSGLTVCLRNMVRLIPLIVLVLQLCQVGGDQHTFYGTRTNQWKQPHFKSAGKSKIGRKRQNRRLVTKTSMKVENIWLSDESLDAEGVTYVINLRGKHQNQPDPKLLVQFPDEFGSETLNGTISWEILAGGDKGSNNSIAKKPIESLGLPVALKLAGWQSTPVIGSSVPTVSITISISGVNNPKKSAGNIANRTGYFKAAIISGNDDNTWNVTGASSFGISDNAATFELTHCKHGSFSGEDALINGGKLMNFQHVGSLSISSWVFVAGNHNSDKNMVPISEMCDSTSGLSCISMSWDIEHRRIKIHIGGDEYVSASTEFQYAGEVECETSHTEADSTASTGSILDAVANCTESESCQDFFWWDTGLGAGEYKTSNAETPLCPEGIESMMMWSKDSRRSNGGYGWRWLSSVYNASAGSLRMYIDGLRVNCSKSSTSQSSLTDFKEECMGVNQLSAWNFDSNYVGHNQKSSVNFEGTIENFFVWGKAIDTNPADLISGLVLRRPRVGLSEDLLISYGSTYLVGDLQVYKWSGENSLQGRSWKHETEFRSRIEAYFYEKGDGSSRVDHASTGFWFDGVREEGSSCYSTEDDTIDSQLHKEHLIEIILPRPILIDSISLFGSSSTNGEDREKSNNFIVYAMNETNTETSSVFVFPESAPRCSTGPPHKAGGPVRGQQSLVHIPCNIVAQYVYIYKKQYPMRFCEIEFNSPTLSMSHLHLQHAQVLDGRSENIVNYVSGGLLSPNDIQSSLASPYGSAFEMLLRWPEMQGQYNFNCWSQKSNPTNSSEGLVVKNFSHCLQMASFPETDSGEAWSGLMRKDATDAPSPVLHGISGYFTVGVTNISRENLWQCGMKGASVKAIHSTQLFIRQAWIIRESNVCSRQSLTSLVTYKFGFYFDEETSSNVLSFTSATGISSNKPHIDITFPETFSDSNMSLNDVGSIKIQNAESGEMYIGSGAWASLSQDDSTGKYTLKVYPMAAFNILGAQTWTLSIEGLRNGQNSGPSGSFEIAFMKSASEVKKHFVSGLSLNTFCMRNSLTDRASVSTTSHDVFGVHPTLEDGTHVDYEFHFVVSPTDSFCHTVEISFPPEYTLNGKEKFSLENGEILSRNPDAIKLLPNTQDTLHIDGIRLYGPDVNITVHGVTNPTTPGVVGDFIVKVKSCTGNLLEHITISHANAFEAAKVASEESPCIVIIVGVIVIDGEALSWVLSPVSGSGKTYKRVQGSYTKGWMQSEHHICVDPGVHLFTLRIDPSAGGWGNQNRAYILCPSGNRIPIGNPADSIGTAQIDIMINITESCNSQQARRVIIYSGKDKQSSAGVKALENLIEVTGVFRAERKTVYDLVDNADVYQSCSQTNRRPVQEVQPLATNTSGISDQLGCQKACQKTWIDMGCRAYTWNVSATLKCNLYIQRNAITEPSVGTDYCGVYLAPNINQSKVDLVVLSSDVSSGVAHLLKHHPVPVIALGAQAQHGLGLTQRSVSVRLETEFLRRKVANAKYRMPPGLFTGDAHEAFSFQEDNRVYSSDIDDETWVASEPSSMEIRDAGVITPRGGIRNEMPLQEDTTLSQLDEYLFPVVAYRRCAAAANAGRRVFFGLQEKFASQLTSGMIFALEQACSWASAKFGSNIAHQSLRHFSTRYYRPLCTKSFNTSESHQSDCDVTENIWGEIKHGVNSDGKIDFKSSDMDPIQGEGFNVSYFGATHFASFWVSEQQAYYFKCEPEQNPNDALTGWRITLDGKTLSDKNDGKILNVGWHSLLVEHHFSKESNEWYLSLQYRLGTDRDWKLVNLNSANFNLPFQDDLLGECVHGFAVSDTEPSSTTGFTSLHGSVFMQNYAGSASKWQLSKRRRLAVPLSENIFTFHPGFNTSSYCAGNNLNNYRGCVKVDLASNNLNNWVLSGSKGILRSQTRYPQRDLLDFQPPLTVGSSIKKIRVRLAEEPDLIMNFRIAYQWADAWNYQMSNTFVGETKVVFGPVHICKGTKCGENDIFTRINDLDRGNDWYEFELDNLIPNWDGEQSLVLEFSHENENPDIVYSTGGVYRYYHDGSDIQDYTSLLDGPSDMTCLDAYSKDEYARTNCGGFPFCGCGHACRLDSSCKKNVGSSWIDRACASNVTDTTQCNPNTPDEVAKKAQIPIQFVLQGELIISRLPANCNSNFSESIIFDFQDKFYQKLSGAEIVEFRRGFFTGTVSTEIYNSSSDINAPNALVVRNFDVSQKMPSLLDFSIYGFSKPMKDFGQAPMGLTVRMCDQLGSEVASTHIEDLIFSGNVAASIDYISSYRSNRQQYVNDVTMQVSVGDIDWAPSNGVQDVILEFESEKAVDVSSHVKAYTRSPDNNDFLFEEPDMTQHKDEFSYNSERDDLVNSRDWSIFDPGDGVTRHVVRVFTQTVVSGESEDPSSNPTRVTVGASKQLIPADVYYSGGMINDKPCAPPLSFFQQQLTKIGKVHFSEIIVEIRVNGELIERNIMPVSGDISATIPPGLDSVPPVPSGSNLFSLHSGGFACFSEIKRVYSKAKGTTRHGGWARAEPARTMKFTYGSDIKYRTPGVCLGPADFANDDGNGVLFVDRHGKSFGAFTLWSSPSSSIPGSCKHASISSMPELELLGKSVSFSFLLATRSPAGLFRSMLPLGWASSVLLKRNIISSLEDEHGFVGPPEIWTASRQPIENSDSGFTLMSRPSSNLADANSDIEKWCLPSTYTVLDDFHWSGRPVSSVSVDVTIGHHAKGVGLLWEYDAKEDFIAKPSAPGPSEAAFDIGTCVPGAGSGHGTEPAPEMGRFRILKGLSDATDQYARDDKANGNRMNTETMPTSLLVTSRINAVDFPSKTAEIGLFRNLLPSDEIGRNYDRSDSTTWKNHCYNAFCNAWEEIRARLCGSEGCSTAAHAQNCKAEYEAKKTNITLIAGGMYPEKCIARALDFYRVEFSASDFKLRLYHGSSTIALVERDYDFTTTAWHWAWVRATRSSYDKPFSLQVGFGLDQSVTPLLTYTPTSISNNVSPLRFVGIGSGRIATVCSQRYVNQPTFWAVSISSISAVLWRMHKGISYIVEEKEMTNLLESDATHHIRIHHEKFSGGHLIVEVDNHAIFSHSISSTSSSGLYQFKDVGIGACVDDNGKRMSQGEFSTSLSTSLEKLTLKACKTQCLASADCTGVSVTPADAAHRGVETEIQSCTLHCTGDIVSGMCPVKGEELATVAKDANNALTDQNRRCFVRQLQSTLKGHVGLFSLRAPDSLPAAHYRSQPGKCINSEYGLNSFVKTPFPDGNNSCSLACTKTATCVAYNYYISDPKCEIFITGEAISSEAKNHLAGFSVSQVNSHSHIGVELFIRGDMTTPSTNCYVRELQPIASFHHIQVRSSSRKSIVRVRGVSDSSQIMMRGIRPPSQQGEWLLNRVYTTSAKNVDLHKSSLPADFRLQAKHMLTQNISPYIGDALPPTNILNSPVTMANMSTCGHVSLFNGLRNNVKLRNFEHDGSLVTSISLRIKAVSNFGWQPIVSLYSSTDSSSLLLYLSPVIPEPEGGPKMSVQYLARGGDGAIFEMECFSISLYTEYHVMTVHDSTSSPPSLKCYRDGVLKGSKDETDASWLIHSNVQRRFETNDVGSSSIPNVIEFMTDVLASADLMTTQYLDESWILLDLQGLYSVTMIENDDSNQDKYLSLLRVGFKRGPSNEVCTYKLSREKWQCNLPMAGRYVSIHFVGSDSDEINTVGEYRVHVTSFTESKQFTGEIHDLHVWNTEFMSNTTIENIVNGVEPGIIPSASFGSSHNSLHSGGSATPPTDFARGKSASISTPGSGENDDPQLAIDDNPQTCVTSADAALSGTHGAWWMVDLGSQYGLAPPMITVLEYLGSNDESGLSFHVGNNKANGGTSNALCNSLPLKISSDRSQIACNHRGRFVSVRKLQGVISICDFKVFLNDWPITSNFMPIFRESVQSPDLPGMNLALGRPAVMSSVREGGDPWRAVDGFHNKGEPNFSGEGLLNTCIQTLSSIYRPESWWRVDLGDTEETFVSEVHLFGLKADNPDVEMSSGIFVHVGNSVALGGATNKACVGSPRDGQGVTASYTGYRNIIPCRQHGRFLSLHRVSGPLSFCEIEVYGAGPQRREVATYDTLSTLESAHLDESSSYTFWLRWPDRLEERTNMWSQVSNPITRGKQGVEGFRDISIDFDNHYFNGLERNGADVEIARTLLDGSIGGKENSLQLFGVKSLENTVCGLSGPDGIETAEVVELFAKRAFVEKSTSRSGATSVSYHFVVVLKNWLPDSPSEAEAENRLLYSYIELTFPPEIRDALAGTTYPIKFLSGANPDRPHARKWKQSGEIRITGWKAMTPGRIEFEINGIPNPTLLSGSTLSESCKIDFKIQNGESLDFVSHGLYIDIHEHTMTSVAGELLGSVTRSKSERCCEYPGFESGKSVEYEFDLFLKESSHEGPLEILFHFPVAFQKFEIESLQVEVHLDNPPSNFEDFISLSVLQDMGKGRSLRVAIDADELYLNPYDSIKVLLRGVQNPSFVHSLLPERSLDNVFMHKCENDPVFPNGEKVLDLSACEESCTQQGAGNCSYFAFCPGDSSYCSISGQNNENDVNCFLYSSCTSVVEDPAYAGYQLHLSKTVEVDQQVIGGLWGNGYAGSIRVEMNEMNKTVNSIVGIFDMEPFTPVNETGCTAIQVEVTGIQTHRFHYSLTAVDPNLKPWRDFRDATSYHSHQIAASHKYCLPSGEYEIALGKYGSYSVSCGDRLLLLETEGGIQGISSNFSVDTTACTRQDILVYAKKDVHGTWSPHDVYLKKLIDGSGYFTGHLYETSEPWEYNAHPDNITFQAIVISDSVDESFGLEIAFEPIGMVSFKPSFLAHIGAIEYPALRENLGFFEKNLLDSQPSMLKNGLSLGTSSTLNFIGDSPTEVTTFNLLTASSDLLVSPSSGQPVYFAMEECMIVLQGRRVGFGVQPKHFRKSPEVFRQLLVSSLMWSSNSSNAGCQETVSDLTLFTQSAIASDPQASTVNILWETGNISCQAIRQQFVKFELQHAIGPNFNEWEETTGCQVTDINARSCIASDLEEQAQYKFRMREKCLLPIASGQFVPSDTNDDIADNVIIMFASKAGLPQNVRLITPVQDHGTLKLVWNASHVSCITAASTFERFEVQILQFGDSPLDNDAWSDVTTCSSSISTRSTSVCDITGLEDNTQYRVRIREVCSSDARSSLSAIAAPVAQHASTEFPYAYTLAAKALSSTDLEIGTNNRSSSWLDVKFKSSTRGCVQAGSDFYGFSVQTAAGSSLPAEDSRDWLNVTTGSCAAILGGTGLVRPDGTMVACMIEGLSEFAFYYIRIFEVCADHIRNSQYLTSERQQTSRRRVGAPNSISIGNAQPDKITISWQADATTCEEAGSSFSNWRVEYSRADGEDSWFLSDTCENQNVRTNVNCDVGGLAHSTSYIFQVYETCMLPEHPYFPIDVSSLQSASSESASTSVQGPSPPSNIISPTYQTANDTRSNVTMELQWTNSESKCENGSSIFDSFEMVGHITSSTDYTAEIVDIQIIYGPGLSFASVIHKGGFKVVGGDHIQIVRSEEQFFNREWWVSNVHVDQNKFEIYLRNSSQEGYGPYNNTINAVKLTDDAIAGYRNELQSMNFTDKVTTNWGTAKLWVPISGCYIFDRDDSNCTATGLTPNSIYEFRSRERCDIPRATSYWSIPSQHYRTLASHALPPALSSKVTCLYCKGNHLEVELIPDDSSCETSKTSFVTWNIQYAVNASQSNLIWMDVANSRIVEDLSDYFQLRFNVTNLTNGIPYVFRSKETCVDDTKSSSWSLPSVATWTHNDCAKGSYVNASLPHTCIPCQEGAHANVTGLWSCQDCRIGKFSNMTGLVDCYNCPRGRFQDEFGTIQCKNCRVGQFANVLGTISCKDCNEGRYSNVAGLAECYYCNYGLYQNKVGKTSCLKCFLGKFSDAQGMIECLECDAGYFMPEMGKERCLACGKGTYSSEKGGTSCTRCDIGMFAPSEGLTHCFNCPLGFSHESFESTRKKCDACLPGFYKASLDYLECRMCQDGYFTADSGSAKCQSCPIGFMAKNTSNQLRDSCVACNSVEGNAGGTYANISGTTSEMGCAECPRGWFAPLEANAAPSCTECAPGFFANTSGMDSCLPCEPGTYSNTTPYTKCLDCPAGTEATTTSTTACRECDKGHYQDKSGSQSPCHPCQQNKYAPERGSSLCTKCSPGYRSAAGSDTCTSDCGSGFLNKTCQPGTFWNASTLLCEECPGGQVCINNMLEVCDSESSRAQNRSYCPPGTGPFALKVPDGSYGCKIDDSSQQECSEEDASVFDSVKLCPKGFLCFDGASTSPCEPGRYASALGSLRCYNCEGGRYQSEMGQFKCLDCPAGNICKQGKETGATIPIPCPAGTYCPSGIAQPFIIPPGYVGVKNGVISATSATDLQECESGEECEDGEKRNCTPGKFSPERRSAVCLDCLVGQYGNGIRQEKCILCASGKAAPRAGMRVCDSCPAGFYASELGATACKQCAAGQYTEEAEEPECSQCPAGYKAPMGSDKCEKCRPGEVSIETDYTKGSGDCRGCEVGTFCDPDETFHVSIESILFVPKTPCRIANQTCNGCSHDEYKKNPNGPCISCGFYSERGCTVDLYKKDRLEMLFTSFKYDNGNLEANFVHRFPFYDSAPNNEPYSPKQNETSEISCENDDDDDDGDRIYGSCRIKAKSINNGPKSSWNEYVDLTHMLRPPIPGDTVIIKSPDDKDIIDASKTEFARVISLGNCKIHPDSDAYFPPNPCPAYLYVGLSHMYSDGKKRAIVKKVCYSSSDPSARKGTGTLCDKCDIDHFQAFPGQTNCSKCLPGKAAPIGKGACANIESKGCPDDTLDKIIDKDFIKNDGNYQANQQQCDNGIFPDIPGRDRAFKDLDAVKEACSRVDSDGTPLRFSEDEDEASSYEYLKHHAFKWQGDLRKQPDWRLSTTDSNKTNKKDLWSYLPGELQTDGSVINGGQYIGDPSGDRRMLSWKRISPRELYTKERIADWCSIAIEVWKKECTLAAIESVTADKYKKEFDCASNLLPIAQVSHIYNHESPLVPIVPHNDTPGGAPEGEPQPWDLYGQAPPPRWFLIEWDAPTFIKGNLLYYEVEVTYNDINRERGNFEPALLEASLRVQPECGTINQNGELNAPCHIIYKLGRPPHLQMYYFRVVAVIDYFDGLLNERIYARAIPNEYRKNERWTIASDCIAASKDDWVGIKGQYLETRRKPWSHSLWETKYSKDRLPRQYLYDEGFCSASDCINSGLKALCEECCIEWATAKKKVCLEIVPTKCQESDLCTEKEKEDCSCQIRETDVPDFKLLKEHAYRFEEDLQDPFLWRCENCPPGADCRSCERTTRPEPTSSELSRCLDTPNFPAAARAPRAWWELRALFGWWRPSNDFQDLYWRGTEITIVDPPSYGDKLRSSLNSTPSRMFLTGNRSTKDKSIYPYVGTRAAARHPFGGGLKFYRCPYRQACLGSENPPEAERYYMNGTKNLANFQLTERCITETGHTGVACSICKKGSHFMTLTGCDTCEAIDGGSVGVKLTIIFTVLFTTAYVIFKFRSLAVVAKDVSRTGKVLINFIQVMGAIKDVYTLEIPSMNVGFNFAAYFKMFNFDLIEMFGIPCLIDMNYYERYVGDMSVIIGLILFIFIIYVIIFLVLKARDSNGGKERRARSKLQKIMESNEKQKAFLEKRALEKAAEIDSDDDEEDNDGKVSNGQNKVLSMFGAKAGPGGKISGLNRWTGLKKGLFSVRSFRKQKMTAQIRLKAICIAAAYYVLLFQHQPASVKTFNMFKCQKIEDTYFLRPDFRLTCFPLNGYHAFAIGVMVILVFGFPAATFYVLYKKRNHLADPITMAQIGFLYFPYRPHGTYSCLILHLHVILHIPVDCKLTKLLLLLQLTCTTIPK